MKKGLLAFLMALSLFIIGCDKGKDSGILGGNSILNMQKLFFNL